MMSGRAVWLTYLVEWLCYPEELREVRIYRWIAGMAIGGLTGIISALRWGAALPVSRGIRHGGARTCNVGRLKPSEQEPSDDFVRYK